MAKTITITDAGGWVTYRLEGSMLEMTRANGCADALAASGCEIDESMDDDSIESAVYHAWTEGYDGDPKANGLAVACTLEEGN
jgi:hypothetical protein